MTTMPHSFSNEGERSTWVKAHASYWTVIRRINRSYERHECSSYEEAKQVAEFLVNEDHNYVCLIYAVAPPYDTWVENIQWRGP